METWVDDGEDLMAIKQTGCLTLNFGADVVVYLHDNH
jgi:hypothetical protein